MAQVRKKWLKLRMARRLPFLLIGCLSLAGVALVLSIHKPQTILNLQASNPTPLPNVDLSQVWLLIGCLSLGGVARILNPQT